MACGLPVVATRSGGLAEVLVEGEEALLVPAGAPERLAAALVELAQDGRRRLEMGLASRHAAVERFDWERVVDRVEEAYRAAIAGRAA
jgi:glycosyltransferase involved in cell wall biosynthesis